MTDAPTTTEARADTTGDPDRIDVPFMLALDAPIIRAPDGRYWAESSWAHDIAAHMRLISRLTFFGVVLDREPEPGMVPLPDDCGTRFVVSRPTYGRKRFWLSLPGMLWRMVREIRRSAVVQSTVAHGEGVPYGWFAYPIARAMGKRTSLVIESSMWRLSGEGPHSLGRRLDAWMYEVVNRAVIRKIDHVTFQHEQYRQSLPAPRAMGGTLYQASWINAEDIIDDATFERRLAEKRARVRPRAIFVTRFLRSKGTRVLVEAIDLLAARGLDIDIDIMGSGEDQEVLASRDGVALGQGRVTMRAPIPYGPGFFDLMSEYDVLLSPNLADEQPRIVYDCGARGVPAIVSDAPGMLSCVVPGETALVVPRGDAAALADAIEEAARSPERLETMGRAARELARNNTHEGMHRRRHREINAMLVRTGYKAA